ncbi:MAG TPA: hypothetical protein VMZ25_11410 [Terriglobales bacterium]|nr:hypothetical protein [Terriglobales bacterium]
MKTIRYGRPAGRLFYLLISVLCMVSAIRAGAAQSGPQLTTIADVIYRANGGPATGTVVISWPAFNTADNKPVAAGELSIAIGNEGTVNFALVPNEGGDPGGTFYKAVYKLSDGTTFTEYWVVPAASPTTIAAIRASVVPRQVGSQFVNRNYVDTALAATNQQVVHKTGGESITGVKTFAASPEVPVPASGVAAVNKDYVTAAVTAISEGFVDKSGDTMYGPLTIPDDPAAPGHATNRHYVDLQVSDMIAGLTLKLGRINDTPISLASVKYAPGFAPEGDLTAQVNAACADFAGANGTVDVPSALPATALRSLLPDNCHVVDRRRIISPNEFGSETTAISKGVVNRLRWTAPNSDVANGSVSTNQTFQGLSWFVDAAKGGINNGTLGATTKSNYRVAGFTLNASTPGQHTALEGSCIKFGAGDCFGVVGFSEMWGGSRPGFGDEYSVPVSARMIQGGTIFTGTVSAKSGNILTFTGTTNHQTLGAGSRWLINKTSGVYSTGTAQFAIGSTTVTGTGTAWASLGPAVDYCFSLDAEESAGKKFVIPVSAWTDDTHLALTIAPGSFVTTVAGAYKLFRCSEVAEVVSNDKSSTTPGAPVQVALVNAANFVVSDQVELPLSHLWGGEGVKIVIAPQIATTQSITGLGIGNTNTEPSKRVHNGIVLGGNFRRGIEFNGATIRPDFGLMWNAGPVPGILMAAYDNSDIGTLVHTLINRRAATGGEARFSYLNSSDQWTFGNNTTPLFYFKTTAPNMGIGTPGLAGTALNIAPAATENGITIAGNATGHLLNAQVASVTRFLVNGTEAYFNSGLDVRGYSDNQTTEKWQITGSNGRANFNGGICQDSAQMVCDLSGAGAPSGACTTGSTYRRTDGGSATSLYVCESSAWVAVGGGGSSTWNAIGNPSGAQALTMGANTSTWTWNSATGAATDLLKLTDSASNTGTGHVLSVETAASSNAKPFQVKARGATSFEINEFGSITALSGISTSSGLSLQVGGALVIKGRDDWAASATLNGADFTGSSSTASNTTVRGGDATSASGATTGGTLLLRSGGATSASGTPGNLQVAQTFLKDTTVTGGLLQCFKAAAAMTVGDCGNSATNSVGVAISASSTNPVVVQFQGIATLQFDASASPSAGWFACSSGTQGGKVTVQSTACAAGRQVGIVAQNGSAITSGKVFLQAR